jgi:dimethylhistidine N-methyltransferase
MQNEKLMQNVKCGATAPHDEFVEALHNGMASKPKSIPSRFFYDEAGSELFEEITRLDEYYPTRTEMDILKTQSAQIASELGSNCLLVEFGSGSSLKTELILDKLDAPAGYVPIDISPTALDEATSRLKHRYPKLKVVSVVADFSQPIALPGALSQFRRAGFFPGSTIGNLHPADAIALLSNFRDTLGPNSILLVGIDLQKNIQVLRAAYNDARGVTAAFNLNLLHRANKEADANFDVTAFRHEAIYDEQQGRIEMHLVSKRAQSVTIGGVRYSFEEGEIIHTENSYKYTLDSYRSLAAQSGWRTTCIMTDAKHYFAVFLHVSNRSR